MHSRGGALSDRNIIDLSNLMLSVVVDYDASVL